MKKVTILSLLFVMTLPFLLGNAAYPYAYPTTYTEYTNTDIVVTEGEDEEEHTYTFTLTNIGNGYIDLKNSYLYSDKYGTLSRLSEDYNPLLAPSNSMNFLLTSTRLDLEPSLTCRAFLSIIPDTTYTILTAVTKVDESYFYEDRFVSSFMYSFSISSNVDKKFYYSAMITYEYEDTTYYTYYNGNVEKPLYFYRGDSLDESKITITNIEFVLGRRINPYKGLQTFFIVMGLIALAGLFFYGVIVVGLIMLIVNQVKKKRAKDANDIN